MNNRRVAAIIVGTVLAGAPIHAQDLQTSGPAAPARFQADIVVTPERGDTLQTEVPAATVVIDAATLRSQPAVSLGEALTFVAGFQVQRSAFHAGLPVVSARGFFGGGEADYVLLLVDGVPALDADSGLADWSIVPLASIRRIEANRGPGASIYGDSAVGGVIQVLTNHTEQAGQVNTTAGSFGTLTVDGADRRQLERAGVEFSGIVRRTSGVSDHSRAEYFAGTAAADGHVGQSLWRLSGSANRRASEDAGALTLDLALRDPGASDPLARFDELHRHDLSTAFAVQRAPGAWSHQERVYFNTRDEDSTRTILLAPGLGDRQARALSTTTIGGSAEGERRLGSAPLAGVVRFGVDLSRESLETSYRPVSDDGVIGATGAAVAGRRERAGVFVSSGWSPAPRLRLSGAVRWDHVDDDAFGMASGATHQAWSPRFGVTVAVSETRPVSLFAQVSTAFKVPTLNQLFDPRPYPDFSGGAFTISNRQLVPQRATNVELGLQGGGANLHWSALTYRMHVHDEIDFDARTFSYANIGESRHAGAELELGGRVWRRLQPSIRYVLTRVTGGEDGRQLKNVPRHSLALAAALDLPLGVVTSLNYRRSGGAFLDDANAIGITGPATFDLRGRRSIGRHFVFIDVLNLTNNHYVEYGFTLTDFRGGAVPYAYPGASRAVRAGVSLAF